MTTWGEYRNCPRAATLPGADSPPRLMPYPDAIRPVRLLFIGWNPPVPYGGFWSRDDDRLLAAVHRIFRDLEWTETTTAAAFREEFRVRGFHFVHAVKCFSRARFPTGAPGMTLVRGCAEAHLSADLEYLRPERVCLLGRVAHHALAVSHAEAIPAKFHRGEWTVAVGNTEVPVITTYFPNDRRRDGVAQWQLARNDLQQWARRPAAQSVGTSRLSFDTRCRVATLGGVLGRRSEVVFAYLFGSASRDALRPTSDVDIAVYLENGTDHDARLAVATDVSRHLRTNDVDVVVLNSAPAALIGRVLADRRVLVDRDPFRRHRFESTELRKFFDFAIREKRLLEARYPSGR